MSVPKPCIVPAPTTVKLPHASGHSSGNRQGHVAKTKTHRFEIFVAFRFTNVYLLLDSSHHLYILSFYHSFNGISPLANYMAKLLWEWKPRFAVALVVRGMLIVTSHTDCDVTGCPVVMRLPQCYVTCTLKQFKFWGLVRYILEVWWYPASWISELARILQQTIKLMICCLLNQNDDMDNIDMRLQNC